MCADYHHDGPAIDQLVPIVTRIFLWLWCSLDTNKDLDFFPSSPSLINALNCLIGIVGVCARGCRTTYLFVCLFVVFLFGVSEGGSEEEPGDGIITVLEFG